jgi:hypothetical protein
MLVFVKGKDPKKGNNMATSRVTNNFTGEENIYAIEFSTFTSVSIGHGQVYFDFENLETAKQFALSLLNAVLTPEKGA